LPWKSINIQDSKRRKLGDEHPETLKRVVNLGINYREVERKV